MKRRLGFFANNLLPRNSSSRLIRRDKLVGTRGKLPRKPGVSLESQQPSRFV